MRNGMILFFIAFLAAAGCQQSQDQKNNPGNVGKKNIELTEADEQQLNRYFWRFCDYTGGMGPGFVPSHTYEIEFRQKLKATKEPELKRLFVLWHLYREVDFQMRDYLAGEVPIGKSLTRKMTPQEKIAARNSLVEKVNFLAKIDPKDPTGWVARYRKQLKDNDN